ncbi:MAG: LytR C-terminal domain-containing protein [Sporichthyaceae bacterium]
MFAGTLLPPLLAVCAVTAILIALFVWLGPDDSDTKVLSARESTPTSRAASPTATPPASSPAAASPSASSPAATTTQPQSEPPARSGPEVVVLNQSGGSGLAQRVAERIRKAGWKVKQISNFHGSVSTTTVYYPDGLRSQARALAKDLPGDPRVKERFSNLSDTRLTVVLTDDYGH